MSLFTQLLGVSAVFGLVALILYVIFGQTTVRKLKKNPLTKDELGMEFVSGWNILNVASALAMPRWINRKLRGTPLYRMYANVELLDKYTNLYDRILAVLFYGLFMLSAISLILLSLLEYIGIFD